MEFQSILAEPSIQPYLYRFQLETKALKQILEEKQVPVNSNPEKVKEKFLRASIKEKDSFLKRISFYKEVCSEAHDENYNLLRDKRFVWKTLKRLGIKCSNDLLEHLQPQDYIEIYDRTGTQVFANFEFCKLISYTIEEMTFYTWPVLYSRSEDVTEQIMGAVDYALTKAKGPFKPIVKPHIAEESLSKSGRKFIVQMKMFSPLSSSDNRASHFIASSRIKRIC